MGETSTDFRLLIETPGISPEAKVQALQSVCSKTGADASVLNFLKVLMENKRLDKLARVVDLFENFYRAEKGMVLCQVTSAATLGSAEQGKVKAAIESRAKGSTLIME